MSIVPKISMDQMWHQHILDTRAYHKDSMTIFGEYFHHFPYFGLRGETDKINLENSFQETQKLYFNEFGEEMVSEYAGSCAGGKCKAQCKSGCKG